MPSKNRKKREAPFEPPEIPFREFAISEDEVWYLLGLSKVQRLQFPRGLQNRLVLLSQDFDSHALKIKEAWKTARANSFWTEEASANREVVEELRAERKADINLVLETIACPTPEAMKRMLDKERIKANVNASKKRSKG